MPPYMERKTRLELATPTLARWCSTTELLPHLWCSGTELNRRHGDFQSPALPTELPEQLATPIRFELTIFAVTGRHVKPLHHGATFFRSFEVASVFLSASNKNYSTTRKGFWQVLFLFFFKLFLTAKKETPRNGRNHYATPLYSSKKVILHNPPSAFHG